MNYIEVRDLYNRLKQSAKKRDIEFNLSLNDLNDLGFPLTCPILGIVLQHNTGSPKDNSYSIDRIDSSKGYVPGNIVVISFRANRIKNDSTLSELKSLVEYYESIII
jgi:hypothetical protein